MPTHPFLLPLDSCSDPALVGGKAAGLGRLIRSGFRVPAGLCVTTGAFHAALNAAGFDAGRSWRRLARASDSEREALLGDCRRAVTGIRLPDSILQPLEQALTRLGTTPGAPWAVRSYASEEDAGEASYGGQYRTVLGVRREEIASAILACWASLWSPAVMAYRRRRSRGGKPPAMAVVIQPLIDAQAAGVVYSRHPLTGQDDRIVINAVLGLAEPLVSGSVAPDQFVVHVQGGAFVLREPSLAEKAAARRPSAGGLVDAPLPPEDRRRPALPDDQVIALARLVKDVEAALKSPVDAEWAMDGQGLWLLQARPITGPTALTAATCIWSRANFKETMPEVPSPLGLSFLHMFMEQNILRHYRELGCRIPPGLSSVRVFRGRPYINVTLFQSLTVQLGGDPAMVLEQMGGEGPPPADLGSRLPLWRRIRAAGRMAWKMRRAVKLAPAWFGEMQRMGEVPEDEASGRLSSAELLARLEHLDGGLRDRDLTLALVAGVSQGLQVMKLLLERRIGPGWRPLLNGSLRGLGTVISARQILWLTELAELARAEAQAQAFLLAEPWEPLQFRARLAGTAFLAEFTRFLDAYGHRAVGESDPVSPRLAEQPEHVLDVIRRQLLAPPAKSTATIRIEQEQARTAAVEQLRRLFARRPLEGIVFRWWHRRLSRFLALREENRHHLMFFTARVRRLELLLGRHLASLGWLSAADDIFFLTEPELRAALLGGPSRQEPLAPDAQQAGEWKRIVAARRAERQRQEAETAPDTMGEGMVHEWSAADAAVGTDARLRGLPISAGYVEGPVRLLRSSADTDRVTRGDIIVAPVIDPGMAPLLSLAGGLVVEMGGTLSHGAIIAREYGLPAVANVPGVTRLLRDGERIALDASVGEIYRLSG